MSRFLRTAAVAALTVAAATAVAGAASAQSYSRLVVFGDSLSDNGNLYAATGNTNPTSPPYFQGRFSNGPVFTELLGFNAGRYAAGASVNGNINLAFGGAVTGVAGLPLGMRSQLTAYTSGGGTFGANDLVSVLGGANNIFNNIAAAGASSNPTGAINPIALGAATDINFIVNSVAAAGAGTVLVTNLPKLSLTPQFRTSPAAPLADYAVTTFNGALFTGLTATAAANPNSNIILMDIYKIGDVIAADPGRFGVSNVTDRCFNGVTVCANPDSYFYWDGVHPTAQGHRVLAALASDYLYYGDNGAETTLQGESSYQFREDMLDTTSESMSSRHGWGTGTSLAFGALVDSTEFDARGVAPDADSSGSGFRLALEHSPSETWRFSMAGSMRNATVRGYAQRFDLETLGLDLGLGWRSGGTFVNVAAGVAHDNYDDITRQTSVPVVHTGETSGFSTGARVQGGVWFDTGGLAVSPRVALTWVSSDVDGYVEQGVAAQYAYQDRTVQGLSAEATLRAEGDFGGMSFYVEGGYRDTLDDSSDAVGTSISGSPSQVLYREFDDPFGGQVIASAGLEREWNGARVAFGYKGRYGDNATSHMGGISVTITLP